MLTAPFDGALGMFCVHWFTVHTGEADGQDASALGAEQVTLPLPVDL